jgi:hypothetical protein
LCCVVCSYLYSIRWSFPVTVCCVCWRRTQHCAETSPPSQPRPRNSFRWVHGGPLNHANSFCRLYFTIFVLKSLSWQIDCVFRLKPLPFAYCTQVEIEGGIQMDAWVMKPPEFDPTKKYPLPTPASVFRLNWKWISLILSIRIGSGRPLFLTATYWASRYPVLVYVYGEPHAQTVLDAWGTAHADYHRAIAEMVFARKQTCSLFCGCHLPYVKMSTRPDRLGTKTNENLKLKRRGAFSLFSSLRVISSFQSTTAAPPAPKALRGAAPSPAASDRFPPRSRCEMSFSSC